jgi:hypothetical protein
VARDGHADEALWRRRDLAHSLGEDPKLSLGIRGGEATITHWRQLELGDIGSGRHCSFVELIDVADVDVDESGRIDVE